MSKRREKFVEERENFPIISPKNERQKEYLNSIYRNPQTIVMGPAGTGKTFLAATTAGDLLRRNKIKKIVLTRPNVPGGRSLGFFPGTLEEKFAHWVTPFTEAIASRMPKAAYEIYLKNKVIEMLPFEVMRGRTFNDAFVILDEAQNTTSEEMKMFLTRIGENCTVVINGDIEQSDLKETSGLKRILHMIRKHNLPIPVIEFGINDIVRSDICAMWIKAFHKEGM